MKKHEKSLSSFFYQNHDVDLDNCSREPVHLIGAIQSVGAMVVFDPEQLRVLSITNNINLLLKFESLLVVGGSIEECLPEIALEVVRISQENASQQHFLLSHTIKAAKENYQVVCHLHDGVGFLEFLPEGGLTISNLREKNRITRASAIKTGDADTFLQAMQHTVDAARKISEFSRITIYQFQDDWSGKIIAESKSANVESFKGLAFPATDIPEQARYLLTLAPFRCLSSVKDDAVQLSPNIHSDTESPFDLSWSLLRSPSVMHTKYLRNMGVEATFVVSLMYRGKLWGMMSCHHNKPTILPFDIWRLMEDLGVTLMAKLSQQLEKENLLKLQDLRYVEDSVASIVRDDGDLVKAVLENMPRLTALLNASGIAFHYDSEVYVAGETPPISFINDLLVWASEQKGYAEHGYVTDALADDWPDAHAYKSTACGVLIAPVSFDNSCHLIWFRAPESVTTTWAGNPEKTETRLESDGTRTLMPRHSFESWVEQHDNKSEKWTNLERKITDVSLKNLLDVAMYQLKLNDNNKRMEIFSYAAAHDIKAPLRNIKFILETIQKEDVIGHHKDLKKLTGLASSAAEQLHFLVDSLMEYLVLSGRQIDMDPVNLQQVIDKILQILRPEIDAADATINIGELPKLMGNSALISSLLSNLITNALRYREPTRKLVIDIQGKVVDGGAELSITDNGVGIPKDKAKYIFEPFKRLHSYSQVAGSGLGLAISLLIAQLHGGEIKVDESREVGARMLVSIKY